jgi:hypothetical protein
MKPVAPAQDRESGFVTVQYVFAVGISFILLALMANLLVDLYARGAVRDALEEGTHSAVASGAAPTACADHARGVLDGLLRGPIGRDIRVECTITPGVVTATAAVRLASWFPAFVPDWRFTIRALAIRDR